MGIRSPGFNLPAPVRDGGSQAAPVRRPRHLSEPPPAVILPLILPGAGPVRARCGPGPGHALPRCKRREKVLEVKMSRGVG